MCGYCTVVIVVIMQVDGWLDFALIQSDWLLGFLKGENFPVTRLKVTVKKFVSKRLFSMVIDSFSFLNTAMIFFLIFFPIHFHYYYY